jgi:hypothetical protein
MVRKAAEWGVVDGLHTLPPAVTRSNTHPRLQTRAFRWSERNCAQSPRIAPLLVQGRD